MCSRATAVVAAAFVLAACSGDRVFELRLEDDARSVFWLFSLGDRVQRVVASDPGTPVALSIQDDHTIHALVYTYSLRELQVEGELVVPDEAAPHRTLAGGIAYELEPGGGFRPIDAAGELERRLRLPPLDPHACAGAGGCFASDRLSCRDDCVRSAPLAPEAPDPPAPPELPRAPICIEGWSTVGVGGHDRCALVSPPLALGRCPRGQLHLFGAAECRPIATRCESSFDPSAPALFVDPSAGGPGSGSPNDPFVELDDALDRAALPGEPRIIELAPGTAQTSRVVVGVLIRGLCAHQTTIRGELVLGDGAALENLIVEGSVAASGQVRLQDVGIEAPAGLPALSVDRRAAVEAHHCALQGWVSVREDAAFTASDTSLYGDEGLAASPGASLALNDVHVEGTNGVVAIAPTYSDVAIQRVAIAGFCRGLHVLHESRVEITDLRVITRDDCSLMSEFAAALVSDNRSRVSAAFVHASGDGAAVYSASSATATVAALWSSSPDGVITVGGGYLHLSHGLLRGGKAHTTSATRMTLEDVVLDGVMLAVNPTSTISASRISLVDPVPSMLAGRTLLEDVTGAAPDLEVRGSGRLELRRAELRGGVGAVARALDRAHVSLEDVRSLDLQGHLARVEGGGASVEIRRVELVGGGLVFSSSAMRPSVRVEDARLRNTQTWDAADPITIYAGAVELTALHFDGAASVAGLFSTTATVTGLEIHNTPGRALKLVDTSSAAFSRVLIGGSGYMLDVNGVIALRQAARARFSDTVIDASGSLSATCIEVDPEASLAARSFLVAGCPLGLGIRADPRGAATVALSGGTFERNGVAIEAPPGFDLGALLQDVIYTDNERPFAER